MAQTIIIGIRSEADAATFLATDWQNYGGTNNNLLYTNVGLPNGYEGTAGVRYGPGFTPVLTSYGVSTNQVTDRMISPSFASYATYDWCQTGNIVAPGTSAPPSRGYVFLVTNDSGLNRFQNQLWTDMVKPLTPSTSQPWTGADYDRSTFNSTFGVGSMWLGDNYIRRALWFGTSTPEGNKTTLYRRVGAPSGLGTISRWIPGTLLSATYTESLIAAPVPPGGPPPA